MKQTLSDVRIYPIADRVFVHNLFQVIEKLFKVDYDRIIYGGGYHELAILRNVIANVLDQKLEMANGLIAKILKRNHATVSHMKKTFQDWMNNDKEFSEKYQLVLNHIYLIDNPRHQIVITLVELLDEREALNREIEIIINRISGEHTMFSRDLTEYLKKYEQEIQRPKGSEGDQH